MLEAGNERKCSLKNWSERRRKENENRSFEGLITLDLVQALIPLIPLVACSPIAVSHIPEASLFGFLGSLSTGHRDGGTAG